MLLFICRLCLCVTLFFFFKQKTAYEMRISDWSSDVCSSDLPIPASAPLEANPAAQAADEQIAPAPLPEPPPAPAATPAPSADEIGRASCRERVCQYV